jgi:dipeptidyl aminopeptidase/acylaminoacyl peptidase
LAQDTFGIDEVLSAPFPEGLVSSPGAGTVAWVYNREGVRNIWVQALAWDGPRQVTDFREDDGQAISGLVLTPDGASVLFVRGGGPNARGEIPNPRSESEGAERAVWIVPVSGGEPRKLVEGGGVTLSPDGGAVAYTGSGGTLWTLELAESAEPVKTATIRDGAGSLSWSPDGARIAFVSGRGDHSFVGVLELGSGELIWLDPSLNLDQDPVWSPDGTRIAFLRIPYPGGTLPFTPVREALPWSIRVVEVGSGKAHTAWTAGSGPGSAFNGVSAGNQLFWAAGDRLVFPWEGNGWLNLYSVPASGGEATPLTPGEFEVQYASLSADGGEVFYSGNQGDIDRQHVWRVPVGGGPPQLLTPGSGIEWSPVPFGPDGAVSFLASGPTTPARAEILEADGLRKRLLPEGAWADFPSGALVEPRQVIFSSADGMSIHGQLFLPRGHRPTEKYPAVLFFHGGSRRQMLLGFHHRGYYHNAYAFNQFLASRGYIVLSVNYRSGIGYGMEFREALGYGAAGASEFNDVLGAGLYLRNRADVNPDAIGLWGGSYGGYLTAMGLARASDLFAAGVDLHGVHDWNVVIKNFVPGYEAEAHPEFAALALASSPMADLDGWRSPVLLIHGDDDRNVPFSESVDLSLELRKRGVEHEELVFPDEVHGFLLHENWIAAFRAASEFLDRKLMQRR